MTETTELPFIDIFSPEFLADPYVVFSRTRERSWIAQTPVGMVVLSYEALQELFSDRRIRQPGGDLFRLQGVDSGPAFEWWNTMLLAQSGEQHSRIRRMVAGSFTAKRVNDYRPAMRRRAEELLDQLRPGQPFDFVEAVADPYPISVFCDIMGIPSADVTTFGQWSTDLGIVGDFTLPAELPTLDNAVLGLYSYTEDLINQRRRDLGDDLLSDLLRAEEAGEKLDNDELKSLIVVLLFGGHDTTRQEIGLGMAAFLRHPAQWRALVEDHTLVRQASEEILRYTPSVIENPRFATEEIVHRGVTIPANTFVGFNSGAANRDTRCAARPEDFDISRAPCPHVTFGKGEHFCLGSAIARAEMEELFGVLVERMPHIAAAGDIVWRTPLGIYGPSHLPMSFNRTND